MVQVFRHQGDPLEPSQVLAVVDPELPGDLHLLRQHLLQARVPRSHEARQDGQRLALQGGLVLRDHTGAAQLAHGAGHQVVQVEQLGTEGQVLDIGDERMAGQVFAALDR
ncbi:hypothetical protein D3C71_1837120 [compost metagenome]